MKKNLYGIVLITSILLTACAQSRNMGSSYTYEPSNSISYQQFYDDLSPYGRWIDNPDFGYVWSPRVAGFRPYHSNGHWAYTDYGWTWVSGYNWGWATFHYGSWYHDNFNGWMWVPGYEWAPAWVSWRQNSNYYGWAPMCPRRKNGSYYEIQNDQWNFIPNQYINRNDLNNYYINNQNNITIINNTTLINNTRVINNGAKYQEGPNVAEVEKITNAKIRKFTVKQSDVPGDTKLHSGVLHIYKPVVKENTTTENAGKSKPGPSKIVMLSNQPQVADGTAKNSRINDVSKKRPIGDINSNSTPGTLPKPVARNDDGADTEKNSQNVIQNSSAENNTNRTFNDKRRKELRNYQQRDNNDMQQDPGNVRSNNNTQRTELNRDNNNINTPSQRVFDNPSRNSPAKINQQERLMNNQQQRPELNQRTFKTNPSPASERPSNFERSIQTTPQNSPGNLNRENNGLRKLRNNQ